MLFQIQFHFYNNDLKYYYLMYNDNFHQILEIKINIYQILNCYCVFAHFHHHPFHQIN